ncbi:MAG: hypothetical protein ACK5AL_02630 [Planctomycetota bacterium]|jgi:hypothetical protein
MPTDKELERLRKSLRHKLEGATAEVAVAADDLRTVLGELGRLHQGNERLRRQNRRMRLKLQRAGLADDEPVADGGDGGDAPADGDV